MKMASGNSRANLQLAVPSTRKALDVLMYLCIISAVIFADQMSKAWIKANLARSETIPLIDGIFHITHVQNFGAAFSILQNQKWFFIIVTSIVSLVLLALIILKSGCWNKTLLFALSLIAGGGAGNLIDRARQGFVTDFFDFRAIHFAIFNVADTAVVCGAGLLLFYLFVIEPRQTSAL